MAFVAPIGVGRAGHPAVATERNTCTVRMRADTEAPPESRVAPYYPMKGRHHAPVLSFQDVKDAELMNMIGLNMEETALDLVAAAELRSKIDAPLVYENHGIDFGSLLTSAVEDPNALTVVDRYFPSSRRYEVPVIELTNEKDGDEDSFSIKISAGKAFADPDIDDKPVANALTSDSEGLPGTVRRAYGAMVRNKAPVIEFGDGELSISMSMQEIQGEPDKAKYDAERFNCFAPVIDLKAPAGDWDTSGYVSVAAEEIQLPMKNL